MRNLTPHTAKLVCCGSIIREYANTRVPLVTGLIDTGDYEVGHLLAVHVVVLSVPAAQSGTPISRYIGAEGGE